MYSELNSVRTQFSVYSSGVYISLLMKCVGDPASIVTLDSMAVKDSLSYEDVPVDILDH